MTCCPKLHQLWHALVQAMAEAFAPLHPYIERMVWLFNKSQTTSTRFWFGLASLGYGSFLLFSKTAGQPGSEYHLMLQLASPEAWGIMFLAHGLSLWFGVISRKFNQPLLMLEGVLGIAVWWGAAAGVTIYQGAPGGSLAGAFISFWLLYRYPTHWEREVDPDE